MWRAMWMSAVGAGVLAAEALAMVAVYVVLRPESGSVLNAVVGAAALASMIAMLVYSVARRSSALRRVFRLSTWLVIHIFLGLQGVLLAYVHCLPMLWRHGWPMLLNPGLINLYLVTIVLVSGLFGRYLYAQVPKALGGQHLEAAALDAEIAALAPVPAEVAALWARAPEPRGLFGLVRAGFARRGALSALRRLNLQGPMKKAAYRRVVLEHHRAAIVTAQRIFRHWIVLHRPLALAMYLFSFVHIAVALLFASSWGWW
ncbi:MAG: hypothetical protein ABMA64_09240 [Myxococcota bacterium]